MLDPRRLGQQLGALAVEVSALHCRSGRVALADYPGGRPFTLVAVSGQGQTGYGEHAAFTDEEQRAFAREAAGLLAAEAGPMATLVKAEAPPYARAALEGALIDLALRQAGASLRDLCGVAEARVRWVRSFEARPDAAAYPRGRGDEVKLDVHPEWTVAALERLRAEPVAILDFKEAGTPALAAVLAELFPSALFEDPPAGTAHARLSRDRPLVDDDAVAEAVARGEAVNLKAPRLGGWLALLRAFALARDHGALAYVGGMFEAGPGREQARQLAALFSPDAPNDLAPLAGALSTVTGPSPALIHLDGVGFGATCDWERMEIL
jgi:hypothetical protein